jgi:hypothetical protein
MKILHYIRRFWEISAYEKFFLLKCFFIILFFRITTILFPIKYYKNIDKYLKGRKIVKPSDEFFLVKLTKKSIYRVGLFLPFAKNCLVKSLSCKFILKQYGIKSIMVFCINKTNSELQAHVYLKINDTQKLFNLKNYKDLYSL